MALDRRALHEFLDLPPGLCLPDALFTHRQCLEGDVPVPIAFDTAGARELLAEAGWSDTDGDGIVAKDGRRMSFTALTGTEEQEAVAVFAQAAFRRIAVDMSVQRMDQWVVFPRVREGDFDAAVLPYWNHIAGHIQ